MASNCITPPHTKMKANKVSLKKRFSVYVLIDTQGNAVEITGDAYSWLKKTHRFKHYCFKTVCDYQFEITDMSDIDNEEVIFLSEPNETEYRLHEKIGRALSKDNIGLNFFSVSNLAEVAMKVTHLHIVFLSEEY